MLFGSLIGAFPLGQFLGSPILGKLSDSYGRRSLLLASLVGTICTLLLCALGTSYKSLTLLYLGRFFGGLMAANMTLAYAALADCSSADDKVKNFAIIPLATGAGFALGPYLAVAANDPTHSFLYAALLAFCNLVFIFFAFPETYASTTQNRPSYRAYFVGISRALKHRHIRPYLLILFFMIAANLLFVQYVGPFAMEKFQSSLSNVAYLYINIGISVAFGHAFLTRRLAGHIVPARALHYSLLALALFLLLLFFSSENFLHLYTCLIMLACAVGYTNAMALVSDQANTEHQGEIMGVAVAMQSLAEFLPAFVIGSISFLFVGISILAAALCALTSFAFLLTHRRKAL
jgi:DHA1 family tetracycline resistance protein-like MFS transporter